MQYLLDSNICVYLMRKCNTKSDKIINRLLAVGWDNCCISEYTVAELYYGAECSDCPEKNLEEVKSFCQDFHVLPISNVLLEFAKQKALLRRKGLMVEDADIFIGATAIVNNLMMVTENLKHIGRLENIKIENWCS